MTVLRLTTYSWVRVAVVFVAACAVLAALQQVTPPRSVERIGLNVLVTVMALVMGRAFSRKDYAFSIRHHGETKALQAGDQPEITFTPRSGRIELVVDAISLQIVVRVDEQDRGAVFAPRPRGADLERLRSWLADQAAVQVTVKQR